MATPGAAGGAKIAAQNTEFTCGLPPMKPLNTQAPCPCGQTASFASCCQPIIQGLRHANSAEQLMRSRYSAHACAALDYLMASWWPEQRAEINPADVAHWVEGADWLRLEVLKTEAGQHHDCEGWVEFIAYYRKRPQSLSSIHSEGLESHAERSYFRKLDERWYFVDGVDLPPSSQPQKLGRNDPCPCGSGKKFKRCCG